jgi:phage shock protein PspC (stress-responsive transcriptional regulator)
MNKTVNINLAGTFFHIDEDAYQKLQRYLEAIKRSFTDSQGRNEIIADIEMRIAELFNERVQNDKQVVSVKEVEEVITIMGQPEDYMVDEEIFEDEPKRTYTSSRPNSTRKLYRDTESAYIGGVSSGLSHYFDVDPLWIRIAWVILFFGFGTGILVYILLWVLMPAAETTSEKLAMSGKPVNINNIEEKVKEGFSNVKESLDGVADRISNADFDRVGNTVKHKSRSFFGALGNIIMFFFKIFAKFIGILLIIIGVSTLIGLIVGLFTVGAADLFHFPGIDFANAVNSTNLPIWIVSLLLLFAVGIPFFYIFILGLKILTNNLKSLGRVANFTLLGLWLASIVTLSVFALRELNEHIYDESVTEKTELAITAKDTLYIKMSDDVEQYRSSSSGSYYRNRGEFRIVRDDDDKKQIFSTNVRLVFRSTKDSLASISVEKSADGSDYQKARERARDINYKYTFSGNKLELDPFHLTDFENKFSDQYVKITLYLPEGTTVWTDDNTYSFHRNSSSYRDIIDNGFEEHYLKVINDDVICLDCPKNSNYKINIDIKDEDSQFKLDSNGLEIKDADVLIKVTSDSVLSETESTKTTIDSSGISIKSKNN